MRSMSCGSMNYQLAPFQTGSIRRRPTVQGWLIAHLSCAGERLAGFRDEKQLMARTAGAAFRQPKTSLSEAAAWSGRCAVSHVPVAIKFRIIAKRRDVPRRRVPYSSVAGTEAGLLASNRNITS